MFWILVEIGFDVLIGNHFVMNVVGYTDWGWGGPRLRLRLNLEILCF